MVTYDLVISGGGPAGSMAAWRAANAGARVLVCDKANFPRDKPCGDGVTPRSVKWLSDMGLGDEIANRFHRVDTFRVVADRGVIQRPWPERDGLPSYGYVAARTELDALMLDRARDAGAEVREGHQVLGPVVEGGQVTAVRTRSDKGEETIPGRVFIAADGMSSRLAAGVGMVNRADAPFCVAVRAQVQSNRPDDAVLECYANLRHRGHLLPGYGWVFPMGGGIVNIGLGYISTYKRWRELNANQLMHEFLGTLPMEWKLPRATDMLQSGVLKGWRLPMALGVWPPWRPGVMAVGDAVAAGKPFTGAGISKAMESGSLAAECAMEALGSGSPADLSRYETELHALWGGYYRVGRAFSRAVGRRGVMAAMIHAATGASKVADVLTRVFTGNGQFDPHGDAVDRTMSGVERVAARLPTAAPERPGAERIDRLAARGFSRAELLDREATTAG